LTTFRKEIKTKINGSQTKKKDTGHTCDERIHNKRHVQKNSQGGKSSTLRRLISFFEYGKQLVRNEKEKKRKSKEIMKAISRERSRVNFGYLTSSLFDTCHAAIVPTFLSITGRQSSDGRMFFFLTPFCIG